MFAAHQYLLEVKVLQKLGLVPSLILLINHLSHVATNSLGAKASSALCHLSMQNIDRVLASSIPPLECGQHTVA